MAPRSHSKIALLLFLGGLATSASASIRVTKSAEPAPGVASLVAVAWDVRVVSAPWLRKKHGPEMPQRSFDLWTDTASMDFGIHSGSFLSKASTLKVGKTRLLGQAQVTFPLNEPFTIESPDKKRGAVGSRFFLEVSPEADGARPGAYRAEVRLSRSASKPFARTLSVRADRGRIWLIPTRHELLGVVLTARPVRGSGLGQASPTPAQGDVNVDLVVLRSDWSGEGSLHETDFPTWLDPFAAPLSVRELNTLLVPLSGRRTAAADVLLHQQSPALLGQFVSVDWAMGQASKASKAKGGSGTDESLSLSLSARRHPDSSHQFKLVATLESSPTGAPSLVRFRSFETVAGETHVWIVPSEEQILLVFTRVRWRR